MGTTKNKPVEVTEHEKANLIRGQEAELKKKYKSNIADFCHYHNVDLSVGWDMLLFNAGCFARGAKAAVIPGGGTINVPELVADYKALMKYNAEIGLKL
jgi:hypothetical protein